MKRILFITAMLLFFLGAFSQDYDTIIDATNLKSKQILVINENLDELENDTINYFIKMPGVVYYWSFMSHIDTVVNDTILQEYRYSPVTNYDFSLPLPDIDVDTLIDVTGKRAAGATWIVSPATYLLIRNIYQADTGYYKGFLLIAKP